MNRQPDALIIQPWQKNGKILSFSWNEKKRKPWLASVKWHNLKVFKKLFSEEGRYKLSVPVWLQKVGHSCQLHCLAVCPSEGSHNFSSWAHGMKGFNWLPQTISLVHLNFLK